MALVLHNQISHEQAKPVQSETAPEKAAESPILPCELILDISLRTDLVTQFKMAQACRDWYFLVISHVASEVLYHRITGEGRYSPGSEPWRKPFDSQHEVAAFTADSLGARKFSSLKQLGNGSTSGVEWLWLLQTGIVSQFISLRTAYIDLSNVESLNLLASCSLPKLKTLTLEMDFSSEEESKIKALSFTLPSLEEFVAHSYVSIQVFEALSRDCPKLPSTTLYLGYQLSYREKLRRAPEAFLKTVRVVHVGAGEMLLPLLGFASFQPEIVSQEYWEDDPQWPSGEDALNIWRGLVQKRSLKELYICDLPSECLVAGLPPNLESLEVRYMSISCVRALDSLKVCLKETKARIDILVDDAWPEWLEDPVELRACAAEMNFWATLEIESISIGGREERDKKIEFARSLARDIEDVIDEMGA